MAKKDPFFRMEVHGLKELDDALAAIDFDLRKKTLQKAGREAMKPVEKAMKDKVPDDTGGLKSTIRIGATSNPKFLRRYGRHAAMRAHVGAGRGSKHKPKEGESQKSGHQAIQVEYGLSGTRSMAARPFIRPAIVGRETIVILRFAKFLKIGVDKAARKQAKKQNKQS